MKTIAARSPFTIAVSGFKSRGMNPEKSGQGIRKFDDAKIDVQKRSKATLTRVAKSFLEAARISQKPPHSAAVPYSLQDAFSLLRVLNGESMWRFGSEAANRLVSSFRMAINPARFLIPVSSATAGLHICSTYYIRKRGPNVLVPSFTWYAVPATVINSGGRPIFTDISLPSLKLKSFSGLKSNQISCAVISHLFGLPALTPEHLRWLRKFQIPLVEDCAQCVTGNVGSEHIGRLGDVAVYSFNGSKHIPAGEGGLIATNNADIAEFATNFVMTVDSPQGMKINRFNSASEGWNYRVGSITASLADSLICSLPERMDIATHAVETYRDLLSEKPFVQIAGEPFPKLCAHLGFPVYLTQPIPGFSIHESRDVLFYMLRLAGVRASVWVPEAMQETKRMLRFYRDFGERPSPEEYRNSTRFSETHIILPTDRQIFNVSVKESFQKVITHYENLI
jgi:dTDP-4-amino-4,6-dideoxygalactose transaminase